MADSGEIGFQAPELLLTGPVEGGLIGLISNEWSVWVCPDLKWEIPAQDTVDTYSDKTGQR